MSNTSASSAALEKFLAAPQGEKVKMSAFDAHGIWTLGVRLMRGINFTSKSLIISLLFLVPIVISCTLLIRDQTSSMAYIDKERLGLEYAKQVMPLLTQLQTMRRYSLLAHTSGKEPAELAEVRSEVQQQMQKITEAESKLGAKLGTTKALAALKAALDKPESVIAGKDLMAVHAAASVPLERALGLLDSILDGSNLSLDPEVDTYYLMDAALVKLPKLVESVASIRGVVAAVASGAPVSADVIRRMAADEAIGDYLEGGFNVALGKVMGQHPELEKKLSIEASMKAMHKLHEMMDAMLGGTVKHSADEVVSVGNTAVNGLFAEQKIMQVELDRLLLERVEGMRWQMYAMLSVMGVCLLLAGYFFYSFFLVTRGGLRLISEHLQEMATGDLRRAPSQPWGRDEPARVIEDLRKAYDSLHLLIRKVRHSARALHSAADEISSASLDLSGRTEAAAASLEEQASAMEEIGATVGATAERAQMAATFAVDNAHVAESGGKVFAEVTTTMREIHASSSKINDIIGVIDGIAFQTNILALNAAVEAARAGESGRGFAVVASEVRSLAKRSADAAREIKILITTSVEKVEGGTKVVQEAGQAMDEVVVNARQINAFLGEISVAAREQATGVKEVGQAIQELDHSTQQNAELVEKTSAAASALQDQANLLQDEIANFKVV